MRIALTGDPLDVAAAAADLGMRSVDIVTLADVSLARALFALAPHRHYVLVGDDGLASDVPLLAESGIPIVFLGPAPAARGDDARDGLFAAAAVHIEGPRERILADLRRYVVHQMASFERPSWDEYFMKLAHVAALRSNCLKRKVAAVIVRDRCVIATGYNGTPRGAKNCNEGGCPRCNALVPAGHGLDDCLCNHAEENAIAQAAFHGVSVRDATLYCTYSPCLRCTKLLINAGIREVVYNANYPLGERALLLLVECGVTVRQYVG
jgi:dCMP deaminase